MENVFGMLMKIGIFVWFGVTIAMGLILYWRSRTAKEGKKVKSAFSKTMVVNASAALILAFTLLMLRFLGVVTVVHGSAPIDVSSVAAAIALIALIVPVVGALSGAMNVPDFIGRVDQFMVFQNKSTNIILGKVGGRDNGEKEGGGDK